MRFKTVEDQKKWYASCQLKCKMDTVTNYKMLNNQEIICTTNFVDCERHGGYDPRDPCNQRCITPLKGRTSKNPKDTQADEVNDKTTRVIKNGEAIDVQCTASSEGVVTCKDFLGDPV